MGLYVTAQTACLMLMLTSLFYETRTQNNFRQKILSTVLNESKYDGSIAPDFDKDVPTEVTVQLSIHDMHSISETSMEYSIDTLLRQWWLDERLNFENSSSTTDKLELDTKSITKVWEPDLYFVNEKRAALHTVTTSNRLMHIYRNGTVVHSMRLALTLTCTMRLEFYPFDSQKCPIIIQSFGYTSSNININWRRYNPVVFRHLEMPQFKLNKEDVTFSDYTSYNSETGAFSVVKVELRLDRKIGYYVLQIIIPSILLVVLSWVSFWVDVDAVAPRVSLGVTCVLTMTTQTSGLRTTLPPVSYVKAIDVWMFVCLLFVFAALLEYAYVNTLSRRHKKKKKKVESAETPTTVQEELPRPSSSGKEGKLKHVFNILIPRKDMATGSKELTAARRADKISRVAFPTTFILFVFVFLCVCNFA